MPRVIPFFDTKVSVNKTIAEIEDMLQVHKVSQIVKNIESGRIISLAFKKDEIPFQLPVYIDGAYQYLLNKRRDPYANQDTKARVYNQAERCAWRNLMAKVKSDLACVELGMVTIVEVFMPYILMAGGETAYEAMMAGGMSALMSPRTVD